MKSDERAQRVLDLPTGGLNAIQSSVNAVLNSTVLSDESKAQFIHDGIAKGERDLRMICILEASNYFNDAIDALIKQQLLEENDLSIIVSSLECYGRLGKDSVTTLVSMALKRGCQQTKCEIMRAIERLESIDYIPVFLEVLATESDPVVKSSAAVRLAYAGFKDVSLVLVQLREQLAVIDRIPVTCALAFLRNQHAVLEIEQWMDEQSAIDDNISRSRWCHIYEMLLYSGDIFRSMQADGHKQWSWSDYQKNREMLRQWISNRSCGFP